MTTDLLAHLDHHALCVSSVLKLALILGARALALVSMTATQTVSELNGGSLNWGTDLGAFQVLFF